MLAGWLFCFAAIAASAQTKGHKEKATQRKTVVKSGTQRNKSDSTVALVNSNSYPAFTPKAETRLRITDPTIRLLNERAAGAPVPKNSSGIIGASKHSNGFANGHVLLRTTSTVSSGTAYGSGAVGTGTSLQGAGVSENTLGANGKSPYAGPSLWGDKWQANAVRGSDSARRQ